MITALISNWVSRELGVFEIEFDPVTIGRNRYRLGGCELE
jgi:hypothetical protein